MTWKQCELGCKLVLIIHGKSHMAGFRFVPKSMTLTDFE